jgi:protein SCO1/2
MRTAQFEQRRNTEMKDANGRNSNPHTHGRKRLLIGGGTILCLLLPLSAQSDEPFRSPAPSAPAQTNRSPGETPLPDVVLFDQDGRPLHFYKDLVKDKVVAINFIFTTCTSICPLSGANFRDLAQLMSDRMGRDFFLISISVDPENDTPQLLKAWGKQFNAGPGWSLLTGAKQDVDTLLKALRAYTPSKDIHSAIVVLGNEAAGKWIRTSGLAAPVKLFDLITALGDDAVPRSVLEPATDSQPSGRQPDPGPPAPGEVSAAQRYFPDVTLITQDQEKMRLYSDLLKGKVVVINSFFSNCQGSCPLTTATLAKIQDWLGDRLGKQVSLISISVAPEEDTPAQLKSFAQRFEAKPGWYFLTGGRGNVNLTLSKLGQYVAKKEDHPNSFVIGNDRTGLWIKASGLTKAEDIIKVVEAVLNDSKRATTNYPGEPINVGLSEIKAVCAK